MNLCEHRLEEVEVPQALYAEALECLLHTIFFVRAPGPVRHPQEVLCRQLGVTHVRCGLADVDRKVKEAIESFLRSLQPAGFELMRGVLTVKFLTKQQRKAGAASAASGMLWGLFGGGGGGLGGEEKVAFEQWKIPVLVNVRALSQPVDETSSAGSSSSAGVATTATGGTPAGVQSHEEEVFRLAKEQVTNLMLSVYEKATESLEHVPPTDTYDFEIEHGTGESRETVMSRLVQLHADEPIR